MRTIPGGLKNAIDWLVSGEVIVSKPIVLAHASHRGDDMLETLRIVLSTVSTNFNAGVFLRFPLMKQAPDAISQMLDAPENRREIAGFLIAFAGFCRDCADRAP